MLTEVFGATTIAVVVAMTTGAFAADINCYLVKDGTQLDKCRIAVPASGSQNSCALAKQGKLEPSCSIAASGTSIAMACGIGRPGAKSADLLTEFIEGDDLEPMTQAKGFYAAALQTRGNILRLEYTEKDGVPPFLITCL